MQLKTRNNINVHGDGDATMVLVHGFGCDQSMWRHLVPAFRDQYRIILFDLVGFCRTDPDIAKHFARVTFLSDHRADLAKSTTPTLILQCTDDLIAPKEVGDFIHRAIPGSQLAMIENTGHCPHLSAPAASIDAMRAYLAGLR